MIQGEVSGWTSISSSSDGSRFIAAAIRGGGIYTSTDGGETWTNRTFISSSSISTASSSDGLKLAVVGKSGMYSSSDGGVTWIPYLQEYAFAPSPPLTISSDGSKLFVWAYPIKTGYNSGGIYASTDFGASWNRSTSSPQYVLAMASSSDGTMLAAICRTGKEGNIFTSIDSGLTWRMVM